MLRLILPVLLAAHLASAQIPAEEVQRPTFATLFFRVEFLAADGRFAEALRALPAVYAEEVPVDSYYDTLARAKIKLLTALPAPEDDGLAVRDHLSLFHDLLTRPDVMYAAYPCATDLEPARYVYFRVIAGAEEDPASLASSGWWLWKKTLAHGSSPSFDVNDHTVVRILLPVEGAV